MSFAYGQVPMKGSLSVATRNVLGPSIQPSNVTFSPRKGNTMSPFLRNALNAAAMSVDTPPASSSRRSPMVYDTPMGSPMNVDEDIWSPVAQCATQLFPGTAENHTSTSEDDDLFEESHFNPSIVVTGSSPPSSPGPFTSTPAVERTQASSSTTPRNPLPPHLASALNLSTILEESSESPRSATTSVPDSPGNPFWDPAASRASSAAITPPSSPAPSPATRYAPTHNPFATPAHPSRAARTLPSTTPAYSPAADPGESDEPELVMPDVKAIALLYASHSDKAVRQALATSEFEEFGPLAQYALFFLANVDNEMLDQIVKTDDYVAACANDGELTAPENLGGVVRVAGGAMWSSDGRKIVFEGILFDVLMMLGRRRNLREWNKRLGEWLGFPDGFMDEWLELLRDARVVDF
ncbi:hypothetical protein CYLTODRAFT_490461 [Cylindrobasidium torrendii FP15055 ss-10]|uniref:Uncharacterized protein n=1 Tax=Cylindrobasidium torrendii FP15055 ss-10 TaxID=1314674 RepID=A0A0D7BBK0_9AGAR|nr:hypothetical protein CYLTODRAFT_490461 [Cylindrobasidium torrendii FP15055 ss-10]